MSERLLPLKLFEGYGIEQEYMVVDCATLRVRPIADKVLAELNGGKVTDEVAIGGVAWSNELVMHVLEIKTNGPTPSLVDAHINVAKAIQDMNGRLLKYGCRLLPTAMHPFFHPPTETVLWPHDNAEIYSAFNRIFDCRGHGWSNMQSIHINLPFSGDMEFARLHAAIRLVLPLIPAIAASSPIVEGKETGFADNRLEFYRRNQQRVPIIAGSLIPERIFSKSEYDGLFSRIFSAISAHDIEGILQHEFLNSRGAIARFQRNAIEIRVTDIQESSQADFTIINAVCALLENLVNEEWSTFHQQAEVSEQDLLPIFTSSGRLGLEAICENRDYLKVLGITDSTLSLRQIWAKLHDKIWSVHNGRYEAYAGRFQEILSKGNLADRIRKKLHRSRGEIAVQDVYRELATCLERDEFFGL